MKERYFTDVVDVPNKVNTSKIPPLGAETKVLVSNQRQQAAESYNR
jgi:hypothetical protein